MVALATLAVAADLSPHDAAYTPGKVERALAVASAAVRDAAGVSISTLTSTVKVSAPGGRLLTLPGPVTAIASVSVGGSAVTDYVPQPNGVYRHGGWGSQPVEVTVEYTHGLPAVPVDIVDLTTQLAIAWLKHDAEGGGSTAGLQSVAIDDAKEGYTDEAAGQVSPVFIPEITRQWLARRFGGGGAVVVETL